MRLAIVDDDEDVRKALARLLRCLGHEVRAFASAEAFEAAIIDVDCLVADVRMPGSSGPELRERLRSRGSRTPMVLITGDPETKAHDISRTFDTPIVVKPFDEVMLMAAIDEAISQADGSREHYAG